MTKLASITNAAASGSQSSSQEDREPRVFKNELELAALFDTIAELAAQICSGEEGSDSARAYAIQKLAEAAKHDVLLMEDLGGPRQ